MKVICIDAGYLDELSYNKIYNVYIEDNNWYLIENNTNYKTWYPKLWFKSILDIRNNKINKLLE